jgi:hypothetical protein
MRATKTGFIVDKIFFSSLWISLKGSYGRGKSLEVVFRIHLIAPGGSYTKPRMIRG